MRNQKINQRGRLVALWLCVAALASAAPLVAQTDPTVLTGRVLDAGTGAPLAGATVRLSGAANESTRTAADGSWRLAMPAPGAYVLTVSRLGFAEQATPVQLPAQADRALTISLVENAVPLERVVVTASRRAQSISEVPVATRVVGRGEIRQSGVADLSTLLVRSLGVQLEGGHPVGEGLMLQGLSSERVLVLLDGQPMVGRISGQIDVSRIPTSMVERIEVVEGAQSSLYGSEAMGGVVNIITRSATEGAWNGTVNLTGGSQGRVDLSSTQQGTIGSVGYVIDAGRRSSEVTPGRAEDQGALSQRWDGLAKLNWSAMPTLNVEVAGTVQDEGQRWQLGQLYTFADNRQWSARLGADWASGAHRLAPLIYYTEFDHLSRRATSSQPVEGTGEQEIQRLLEAEVLYNLQMDLHTLDLGVETKREEIVSDRVQGHERALYTVEPFAQATWVSGDWRVVPGARLSWSEQWGTHLTPNLAVLFRPVESLSIRGSVGRGFRAPGFKELHMEFLNLGAGTGYTVRGNPDLKPESSTSVSGGVEWLRGTTHLRGTAFSNDFDDFIETRVAGDSSGITVHTYGNIASGWSRGVDLEVGVERGGLQFEAGYGFLTTRDRENDVSLLGRARHSGRMSIGYGLSTGTRAGLVGVFSGKAPVQRDGNTEVMRDGFFRVDLTLTQTLPRGVELALGARNLLDTQPENWPGFTRRHLYAGIGWTAGNDR